MKRNKTNRKAFSTVEVLLAIALFSMLVLTLAGALAYSVQSASDDTLYNDGINYAEEGINAVRSIRFEDYANLADGNYGLDESGGEWAFSGTSDISGEYTRQVQISTIDPHTKQVTVNITWLDKRGNPKSTSLVTYLTDWYRFVSVGDWSIPTLEASTNLSGNTNGTAVVTQGNYAYVIRSGAAPDFQIIDISVSGSITQLGSLNIAGNTLDIEVAGNYVYIASNDNSNEVTTVNITNPNAPVITDTYNAPGNDDIYTLMPFGNYLLLGKASGNEFEVVDKTNPNNLTFVSSLNLSGNVRGISVVGNYAYLASGSNTQELQVINITNPASPSAVSSYNISSNNDYYTIDSFGNHIIMGDITGIMYVFNITNPLAPTPTDNFTIGSAVREVVTYPTENLAFVGNDNNSYEFIVLDVSDPSNVSSLATINFSDDINGLDYNTLLNYVVATSESNSQEVIVIEPG